MILINKGPNPYASNPYASAGVPFGGATPFGVGTNGTEKTTSLHINLYFFAGRQDTIHVGWSDC